MAVAVTPEYYVRIGVDRYRNLPDGLRKAFLAGVLDMICVAYVYASDRHKARITAIANWANQFGTDQLTQKFDEYILEKPDLDKFGAAGIYFIALGKLSGIDK